MPASARISVFPSSGIHVHARLFQALSELYDLVFVPYTSHGTFCASIFLEAPTPAPRPNDGHPPSLTLHAPTAEELRQVDFHSIPDICAPFQNRRFKLQSSTTGLTKHAGRRRLASTGTEWLWSKEHGLPHYHAVGAFPKLDAGEFLCSLLHCPPFVLIPLLAFLRPLSPLSCWAGPGLRANIMFDDPNLHALSYGYIGYESLVDNSKLHNYHVALATIPFDAWFTNRTTAAYFAAHRDRLSLLIHGNNHNSTELLTRRSDASRALLAQALRRVQQLELKSRLSIPRIMAAPYGACSDASLETMLRLQYEGACISFGSLLSRNPHLSWKASLGCHMSELFKGFPIMHRFRMNAECDLAISWAAFFHQPIIPVGHHENVSDGFGLLESLAAKINSLGPVSWSNMQEISRSQFFTRQTGSILHVRSYSRRIRIPVSSEIEYVSVHPAWTGSGKYDLARYHLDSDTGWTASHEPGHINVRGARTIEMEFPPEQIIDPLHVPAPAISMWAAARRVLTEARDRAIPALRRRKRQATPRTWLGSDPIKSVTVTGFKDGQPLPVDSTVRLSGLRSSSD